MSDDSKRYVIESDDTLEASLGSEVTFSMKNIFKNTI
jgi:hypothetical protein